MGGVTTYHDQEGIKAEVITHLRNGLSLRAISRMEGMPSHVTILDWVAADEGFADQYTRAREIGWNLRAERAVEQAEIAEDAAKGRLAFDAERWYLGKMMPKVYGDRQVIAGDPEAPILSISDAQLDARLMALISQAEKDNG